MALVGYDSSVRQSNGEAASEYLVDVLEDRLYKRTGGGDVGGSVGGFEPGFLVTGGDTKLIEEGVDLETRQEGAFTPAVTWNQGADFRFLAIISVSFRDMEAISILYVFNLTRMKRHPE